MWGLANYAAVLSDPIFLASLGRTLLYTVLSVVANLTFALLFAILLDSTLLKRGNLFFRLALFLPVITPDVAGYVVWRWLYDRSFGAINAALTGLGLPPFGGLSSVDTAMLAVLIAELWHHAGFYMIIFLANLSIRDSRARGGSPYRWRNHMAALALCDHPAIAPCHRDQHGLRADPVPQDLHGRGGDDQGRAERPDEFRLLLRLPALRSGPLWRGNRDGDHPFRHRDPDLAHGLSHRGREPGRS